MKKKRASKRLHRIELVLWIAGAIFLGGAIGTTAFRWSYQARQEQALFSPGRPVDRVAEAIPPRRDVEKSVETAAPAVVETVVEAAPVVTPAEAAGSTQKQKVRKSDPFAVGRIEIPRLGLRAVIRKGADEDTLARAVGLVPGAAFPGELGNVVLAGHRDTFFHPLRKIRVDDRIRLRVPPNEYEYRVESVRVVTPEETGVLQSKGVEELTLVTCYPFRFIGPAPDRFIVSATRVN